MNEDETLQASFERLRNAVSDFAITVHDAIEEMCVFELRIDIAELEGMEKQNGVA